MRVLYAEFRITVLNFVVALVQTTADGYHKSPSWFPDVKKKEDQSKNRSRTF